MLIKLVRVLLGLLIILKLTRQQFEEHSLKENREFALDSGRIDQKDSQWQRFGDIRTEGSGVVFNNSKKQTKAILLHRQPLPFDNFFQLKFQLKTQMENIKENETNVFMVQLSQNPVFLDESYTLGEEVYFQGMVLFFFVERKQERFLYKVYHQFFQQEFLITSQYLLDMERYGQNKNQCQFEGDRIQVDFQLDFDLVQGVLNFFYFQRSVPMNCFKYADLQYELVDNSIYLAFQTFGNSMASVSTFLENFQLFEKKHVLSNEQVYNVSHELNDEIMAQIASYSKYLTKNKKQLNSFLGLQNQLKTKSSNFQFLVKDFYSGSRRFQEYIYRAYNTIENKDQTNNPKLVQVQEQLRQLNRNQERFQQSFVQTVQYIDKNGIMKKIEKSLGQINTVMGKIIEFERTGQIEKFVKNQQELVDFVSQNDFSVYINSIDQALSRRKRYREKDHKIILAIITAASVTIVIIAALILYKINQAEKQSFA